MNLVAELRKVISDNDGCCYCHELSGSIGVKGNDGCKSCKETIGKIADIIEKYYFPKPLFEDGEPVNLGDKFISNNGMSCNVTSLGIANNYFAVNPCAVSEGDRFGYWQDECKRVKRPVGQTTIKTESPDVESYLSQYTEGYLKSKGNGVYEEVKMVPIDVVDDAIYMLRNYYEEKGNF